MHQESLETINYKDYTIGIFKDDDPENPREWDNLGEIVSFNRHYNLGDKHNYSFEEVQQMVASDEYITLEVYLYDHSIQTIRASLPADYLLARKLRLQQSVNPFIGNTQHAEWDSGLVGWILVSKEKVRKEFGWQVISKDRRHKIIEYLNNEVETYDQYLQGDVWGYSIEDPDEDHFDSCNGFYGYDYCLEEAQRVVDFTVNT